MDALSEEFHNLSQKAQLNKSLDDVQKIIDLLGEAQDSIRESMSQGFSSYSGFFDLGRLQIQVLRP
jgi:hypothetical protein